MLCRVHPQDGVSTAREAARVPRVATVFPRVCLGLPVSRAEQVMRPPRHSVALCAEADREIAPAGRMAPHTSHLSDHVSVRCCEYFTEATDNIRTASSRANARKKRQQPRGLSWRYNNGATAVATGTLPQQRARSADRFSDIQSYCATVTD